MSKRIPVFRKDQKLERLADHPTNLEDAAECISTLRQRVAELERQPNASQTNRRFTIEDRSIVKYAITHNLGVRLAEAVQHLLDDSESADAWKDLAQKYEGMLKDGSYRCFHCGNVFTPEEAAIHFGGRAEGTPTACLIAENAELKRQLETAKAEELIARELLWIAHSQGMGYGDDGEMQHNMIDYKRQSFAEIRDTITRRNLEYMSSPEGKAKIKAIFDAARAGEGK